MNKLIRASAGSGKTFQLSGHYLRQLFLKHRPETILATTFTRKAAGEILGRVLTRLAEAAESDEAARKLGDFLAIPSITAADALQLLQDVTRNLHRMRVCTLDSFFQQVARSLTLELGLPPGWSIVDEHIDRELREQAIDAVLSQHVPQDAQQLMQMLAKGRSKRSVRDLIDDTVTNYHELFLLTDDAAWNQLPKHHRLTTQQKEDALRRLAEAELPDDNRMKNAREEDLARFQAENWDEFVKKGLAGKVLSGSAKYFNKVLDPDLVEIYQRLISHAKAELLDRLIQQMKAIRSLMTRFDREYSRLRSEHGWLRFGDVTRVLARSASAASGSRMNFRLDSSLRNLLLDEFQDTSADQWQVLKRLAVALQNWGKSSSFFCVGDGKQAIYGWRGGVAAILNAVPTAVPGIEESTLDQSRRSSPVIMDVVNRVFQNIASHPELEDYQQACLNWSSDFPQHSTANAKMPGYVCLRTSPELEGETAEERRVPWFQWVASQIRDLHRACPTVEIGVLTRRNATVARLVHELTRLGVPASEEGGTPPTDSPAVLALMSLLHFVSHPACRVSRFHAARSPFGRVIGLTTWRDDHLATKVAAELRSRLMDLGYGRFCQWLSEEVREHCSVRDKLRLSQVVSEAWRFDKTGSLNSCDFVRLLENSKFQKSDPAPVRVMTIHQSKGLEFDCVVLPELEGMLFQHPQAAFTGPSVGEPPDRVCVWSDKALRLMFPVSLQQAFDDTVSRHVAESLCVFYVAMTRAKHSMHLLIPPVPGSKIPKSYAGLLLAALTQGAPAAPDTMLFQAGDREWYRKVDHLTDQVVHVRPARHGIPKVQLSRMTDGRRRGLQRRAPSRHDETRLYLPDVTASILRREAPVAVTSRRSIDPRVRGTVMHAWFECIEWLRDDEIPNEAMLRERAETLTVARETIDQLLPEFLMLVEQSDLRCAFDRATGGRSSAFAAHADVLRSAQCELHVERERPFVRIVEGQLVTGTIDRLVRLVLHGRTIAADIVDFKTDRLVGDTSRWIREKQEHYGPQLREYGDAVAAMYSIDPGQISRRLLLLEARTIASV